MAAAVRGSETFWSTTLPPVPGSVSAARHFATDAMHGLGIPGRDERAELLVSELATNAVLHAGTPMRISIWRHDDQVRFEVRDDDPTPPRSIVADRLASGGRGIMLVDALSSSWGVNGNERGKTIWFELGQAS